MPRKPWSYMGVHLRGNLRERKKKTKERGVQRMMGEARANLYLHLGCDDLGLHPEVSEP